jgi:hypothetical protein
VEVSIHRFFSPAELRQLESGLPRLAEWSSEMLVPFRARQLRHATILWINRRWFLERMIDVMRDDVRERVSSWLLDEFAYMVPQTGDPQEAFTNATRMLHADRYGSSTGRTLHGGSGRVATIGCFQAKGVGVTPLVGVGGDGEHATGCTSVEESIREAIFSEVTAAEFPHGAIPVVAILDTGLCFSVQTQASTGGRASRSARRAIVIRPAVLRIAHAERAPLFTRSLTGYSNSQRDDVQRTRDVVQRWSSRDRARQQGDVAVPDLPELVSRIAGQVAFGQVHRLFSGGYFSSNLSVTGALLDFGGMRALPNWVSARNLDTVVGFGDEMKIVNKVIESLGFYLHKYRPQPASSTPSAAALRSHAQGVYKRAFTQECLRMWNVDPQTDPTLTDAMMLALNRYFSWQQKFQANYKHGVVHEQSWLYDSIVGDRASAPSIETQTLDAISAALQRQFVNTPDRDERTLQAWSSAVRYLMPRESLDREKLQQLIERRLAADRKSRPSRKWVADFVRTAVGKGRRHWPRLPSDLTVRAQVAYEGSSALLCLESSTRRLVYWLEGIRVRETLRLFDSCITDEDARAIGARSSGAYWTARVSISDLHRASSIQIPNMQVEYGQPSRRLTATRNLSEESSFMCLRGR